MPIAILLAGLMSGCQAVTTTSSPPPLAPSASAAETSSATPDESEMPALGPSRPLAAQVVAFTFEGALYTALGTGSERTLITDFPGDPFPYAGAYWSPDGHSLLVRMETDVAAGGGGFIYKVSADGSDIVNLSAVSGARHDAMPAWSPDGKQIVYAATNGQDPYLQLYVMNADGTAPRLLVRTEFEAQYPAWSTSGRIAFAGVVNDNFDIYSMKQDGSDLRRLTDDPAQDNWPTWSPDGTELAFFSSREGMDSIWAMAADGTGVRRLAEGGEPNWSSRPTALPAELASARSGADGASNRSVV